MELIPSLGLFRSTFMKPDRFSKQIEGDGDPDTVDDSIAIIWFHKHSLRCCADTFDLTQAHFDKQ